MYELVVALKYLIPRKKQLSVSLIALMSIVVISLVVWLLLVFLSVTEGIERGWLNKLTTLNAPLRITPTQYYYDSYYYKIDEISSYSQFKSKNIAQKLLEPGRDPFNPEEDGELPAHYPPADLNANGQLKDPVALLYHSLDQIKGNDPYFAVQDFEMSGALMRLQLLRPSSSRYDPQQQNYLTQVSYLASFPENCPELDTLLVSPSEKDINHMLYLASHATEHSRQDAPSLILKSSEEKTLSRLENLLKKIKIQQLKPKYASWKLPFSLLPEKQKLTAHGLYRQNQLLGIEIPTQRLSQKPQQTWGKVWREGKTLYFENPDGNVQKHAASIPLFLDASLRMDVDGQILASPIVFAVKFFVQNYLFKAEVGLEDLEVVKANYFLPFLKNQEGKAFLPVNEEQETGVLLSKSYQDSGVLIGDRGYLSYSSTTAGSIQEHRLPIFVAGFYDSGILSIGNKCILVPPFVTETINASSSSFNLDKTQSNGVLVWFKEIHEAEKYKGQLSSLLESFGIEKYWKITTFKEYDFAKDLIQQFQSDKYLFAMIGIIILIVACCNIISLLVLLVNDKKKEIGILQAMGASRTSIAFIFGTCGVTMGIISSVIGISAALFTLHHMDSIIQLLSFIQGQEAFNAAFFGKTLPNELSKNAVYFILITTPLLSLFAGLIPAFKACRLRPSQILRSE